MCAYAQLEKADEGLEWLMVVIRLNPALKKLVAADKDLVFLREKHGKALEKILK